jgi:tripartite-type tricarboxylate transporter receptor subunit TctC
MMRIVQACLIAVQVAVLSMATAQAAQFNEKRVTLIVPYAEGGGGSVYTRFFAPYFEKHLPGKPTIIVRNIAGGSSVKAFNQFMHNPDKDGSQVINSGTSTFFKYVLRDKSVQYDFKDMVPIISSPLGALVYTRKELGAGTGEVEKLKGKKLVIGARSPTSGDINILLAFHLLGLEVKPIFGLSTGKRRLAFQRGEATLCQDNSAAYSKHVEPLIKEGTAVPLFTLGFMKPDGTIARDPMLPDIPTFMEVYKRMHGKELSGPALNAWRALFTVRVMAAKMFFLPKVTSPEIIETYHQTMAKIMKDPDFIAKRENVIGPYDQSLGKEALAIMRTATELDDEARAWLLKWLNDNYSTNLETS